MNETSGIVEFTDTNGNKRWYAIIKAKGLYFGFVSSLNSENRQVISNRFDAAVAACIEFDAAFERSAEHADRGGHL